MKDEENELDITAEEQKEENVGKNEGLMSNAYMFSTFLYLPMPLCIGPFLDLAWSTLSADLLRRNAFQVFPSSEFSGAELSMEWESS